MFSLKIASLIVDSDTDIPIVQMFFADVSKVSVIDRFTGEDDPRLDGAKRIYNPEDYTGTSGGDRPVAPFAAVVHPITMLVVWFGRDDYKCVSMLVERAWLLGPTGDTIERIAP